MKKGVIILSFIGVLGLTACSWVPSIDEVEKETREGVEELLTEDNNEDKFFRLDRYFLNEHPDLRTFTGTLKATYFYKNEHGKWDFRRLRWIAMQDSMKVYRKVIIKYRDLWYDAYTMSILPQDD